MDTIKRIVILLIPFIVYCIWVMVHANNNKHSFKKELFIQASNDSLNFFIALFIVCFAIAIGKINAFEFDYDFFFSIILTYIVALILLYIRKIILNKVEDSAKLTDDIEGLMKKYKEDNWFIFDNTKVKFKGRAKDVVRFPDIIDLELVNKKIIIEDDKDKMYEIPNEIKSFENKLYTAHDTSNTYNQLNIRMDDWYTKNNNVYFKTSRTTYFKSLVTNRVLDYKLLEEKTVRELLMYGPFLPNLKESKLSNHLGINGFVISNDNYIPLILRQKKMSISKNVYGPSIGASLKAKYCLNENKELTMQGIVDAIYGEIKDELKLEKENIIFDPKENIIYAYRDVYEGSKPQLLFYAHSSLNRNDMARMFMKGIKKNKKSSIEEVELEDGNHILWINTKDLKEIALTHDCFFVNGDKYKSSCPSLASLGMFINYYLEKENGNKASRSKRVRKKV